MLSFGDILKGVAAAASIANTVTSSIGQNKQTKAIERAGQLSVEGLSEAQKTQLESLQREFEFLRQQSINEGSLAKRLQDEAISADERKLDRIIGVFNRAIDLEQPFQTSAQGFISPLEQAISEFPEFQSISAQPISDEQIQQNIPKALTDLQNFEFNRAGREVDKTLSAAGLTGSGAGLRAREAALRPLALDFALQGFREGQNRILLNEQRLAEDETRRQKNSLGRIGALGGSIDLLRRGNQVPGLLSNQAGAIGQSSRNQNTLSGIFGQNRLGALSGFKQLGAGAVRNFGTNTSDLQAQRGLNLANTQFRAGQSRANQISGIGQNLLQGATGSLNFFNTQRLLDSLNLNGKNKKTF